LAADTTEFLDFCLKTALSCEVPLEAAFSVFKELEIQIRSSTSGRQIVSMQSIAILVGF
jgi:hypothetical protein